MQPAPEADMAYISVQVDLAEAMESLAIQSNQGQLIEAIVELDKGVADVSFTDVLVKALVKSLLADLSEGEFLDFINELRELGAAQA